MGQGLRFGVFRGFVLRDAFGFEVQCLGFSGSCGTLLNIMSLIPCACVLPPHSNCP